MHDACIIDLINDDDKTFFRSASEHRQSPRCFLAFSDKATTKLSYSKMRVKWPTATPPPNTNTSVHHICLRKRENNRENPTHKK